MTTTDSTEVWVNEADAIVCKYGTISEGTVSSEYLGEIRDVGPLVVVSIDADIETRNLGRFGVKYWVTDGNIAHIKASNGEWIWRLEPAHWRDGVLPAENWHRDILIGRWPD